MKIMAVSSTENVFKILDLSANQGYITFIYHHADPKHELLKDKFLYVHDDLELSEKVNLLRSDFTIQNLIKR